jgi:hypothetical protein
MFGRAEQQPAALPQPVNRERIRLRTAGSENEVRPAESRNQYRAGIFQQTPCPAPGLMDRTRVAIQA